MIRLTFQNAVLFPAEVVSAANAAVPSDRVKAYSGKLGLTSQVKETAFAVHSS